MSVWAIVVAAGDGRRYGGLKQYEVLDGMTVLARSILAARHVADGVVAVVPPSLVGNPSAGAGADVTVGGGATRSESVRAGLAQVPADAEIIVIHDAARPLASTDLFDAVVGAVTDGPDAPDGAVPGVPVTDTVKQIAENRVVATLDRASLVTVQTPQAFRAMALRAAHLERVDATDDAALLERDGHLVVVIAGESTNIKITDPDDFALAARILADRAEVPS